MHARGHPADWSLYSTVEKKAVTMVGPIDENRFEIVLDVLLENMNQYSSIVRRSARHPVGTGSNPTQFSKSNLLELYSVFDE